MKLMPVIINRFGLLGLNEFQARPYKLNLASTKGHEGPKKGIAGDTLFNETGIK
jgi:hypothetical protein